MVEHDTTGENQKEKKEYPKFLIERTATIGTIVDVGSWSGKDNKGKDKEKIILSVQVKDNEAMLQCWLNASVKKNSDPKYNTGSYNVLRNLGLLEKFEKFVELDPDNAGTLEGVEAFFLTNLSNKEVKFVPETITPKDGGDDYSSILILDGFADATEEPKVEKETADGEKIPEEKKEDKKE